MKNQNLLDNYCIPTNFFLLVIFEYNNKVSMKGTVILSYPIYLPLSDIENNSPCPYCKKSFKTVKDQNIHINVFHVSLWSKHMEGPLLNIYFL